jgi:hypothetical protein
MALGMLFSFAFGAAMVLGRNSWEQISPDNSRKILANEILNSARHLLRYSRNGSSSQSLNEEKLRAAGMDIKVTHEEEP